MAAAEIPDRRHLARVDPLLCQDDAVDAPCPLPGLDRGHVEIAEQRQLVSHRMRERAGSDDQDLLARGRRPPERAATKREVGDDHHRRHHREVPVSRVPAGVRPPSRLAVTVPTTPQAKIAGASSTVRWRIARWSAS